jgi:hypothetical protein
VVPVPVIIENRSTNQVITEVRTSILLEPAHLHAKRIADTLENLYRYFLYHFCRIRMRIGIRKKNLDPNPKKINSDPQHCFILLPTTEVNGASREKSLSTNGTGMQYMGGNMNR